MTADRDSLQGFLDHLTLAGLAGASDGALLSHYLAEPAGLAFTALVRRHQAMIHATARRVLGPGLLADADDVTQAVFLILLARAQNHTHRTTVGDWLHGVTLRTAKKARARAARRRVVEAKAVRNVVVEPTADDAEWRARIDRAVRGLAEHYRQAVVLCDLEGVSRKVAARRLGIPEGTLSSRLTKAHKLLARKLGATVPLVVILSELAQATPPVCVASVVRADVSVVVNSLAREVLLSMIVAKVKLAAMFVAGTLAAGIVGATVQRQTVAQDRTPPVQLSPVEQLPSPLYLQTSPKPEAPPAPRAETPAPATPPAIVETRGPLPKGSFARELALEPWANGQITWNFDGNHLTGIWRVNSQAVASSIELEIEAEVSVSTHGVIYGIVNSVKLTGIQINPQYVPEGIRIDANSYAIIEPVVNDLLVDVPFSFHIRNSNGRFTLSQFRMLVLGASPLGKLGGLMVGGDLGAFHTGVQALSTAFEGTYTRVDPTVPRPAPPAPRPVAPVKRK